MRTVDTLLHARWIVPVEPAGDVLQRHSLAIDGGRIDAILPTAEAREQLTATAEHELSSHALLPGLINAHTHAAMTLMRGMADDLPLMEWLNEHIWPAEARCMNADYVRTGTELAIIEMLRSGITCFNDMYFFPEVAAAAVRASGMRAVLGMIVIEFPSAWAQHADEYIDKGLEFHDSVSSDSLLRCALAPHAPYTVSDATLGKIVQLAEQHDLPIHTHVHETAAEIEQWARDRGGRPFSHLDRLGVISPRLAAVHMTQLEPAEIERAADSGLSVLHCPESNLKLASGFCPVAALADAGVNVAIGTDGAASNNDLDMFGELRSAALLGKAVAGDAAALPAAEVLQMATLNGARALGLGREIGSLKVGKQADVIAVDLAQPESEPVYNPISQLVYATGRHQVSDAWVAGSQRLRQREVIGLAVDEVIAKAREWRQRIGGD